MDWQDIDRIRVPGFSLSRRGYDRHEVDRFLARLADWLETDAASELGQIAVTRKLELVGKSTAHILMATEQESAELRRNAEEECAQMVSEAEAAALQTREAADEYAQQTRGQADADARRLAEAADTEARETIEEGERRRGQIEAVIADLEVRRDDALSDLERLRGALAATIADHRQAAPSNRSRGERVSKEKEPAASA
ncbi:MAG TPA: DivIVA domain-containing protein [Solirubrobacteraceae bacterium]